MRTIVFSLIAMFCYAVGNVLLEQKLSKFNNLTIITCYSFVVMIAAFTARQFVKPDDASLAFPRDWSLLLMVLLGFIFFAADYFQIGAYTQGGNLMTIAAIVVMYPVFASCVRFVWVRELPTVWHIAGYVLAAAAVLLITKGNAMLGGPK